jgi:hypothetical protein
MLQVVRNRWAAEGRSVWWSEFAAAVRRDHAFYCVVLTAVACALILGGVFGRAYFVQVAPKYLNVWLNIGLFGVAAASSAAVCRALVRARPEHPLAFAWRTLREVATPERAAGALLFSALGVFMSAFISIKCLLPMIQPFWADTLLADASRVLGHDDWRWLHPWLAQPAITRAIEVAYIPGWMLMLAGSALYFSTFCRRTILRQTFLSVYLTAWVVNGLIVACLFMSAGPAFYAEVVGDAARYRELVNYLAFDRESPISAAAQHHWLLMQFRGQKAEVGAGISAFPSLHVTMVMLVTIAAWKVHRFAGVLCALFAAVIIVGSVHLAWHYAVDGLFALASVPIMWVLAQRLGTHRDAKASLERSVASAART